MEHNGTLGFSWKTKLVSGARTTDYLAPQLQKIFETIGFETSGEYEIIDTDAKDYYRSYKIYDRNNGQNISVLSRSQKSEKGVYLNVQVIDLGSKYNTPVHFGSADFDGDDMDEIFTFGYTYGADHDRMTLGIFPFAYDYREPETNGWDAPLFWAVDGGDDPLSQDFSYEPYEGPFWGVPHYFGFTFEQNNDKTWTVRNSFTGYSRTVPNDTYYYNGSADREHITSIEVVDVDADGAFELIIEQYVWHSPGECVSLLQYDTAKKAFQTLHAEFRLFDDDERNRWELSKNERYADFLTRAGYDPAKAVFKDY